MKTRSFTPRTRTALVTLGALLLLVILLLTARPGRGLSLGGTDAATREDRVRFLSDCGWTVDPATESCQSVRIPDQFSPVYESYNELQRQQGYDLGDYRGRDCLLYTYAVTNWPDNSQTVQANLYVYKNRVIGGDVHSTNLDGFMVGLK